MNEKDFKKLDEKLRKQQAQIAKQREKQSPTKISEITCSIPNSESTGQSEPVQKCERCGKTDCELITPVNSRYRQLCPECEAKRQEYLAEQQRRELRRIRHERERKRDAIRRELRRIIPSRYLKVRLNHLGQNFKRELLSYNKTTGLVLCGPVGTGKTTGACALLRSLIASGLKCDRIGYEELCLMIRSTFKSQSPESELDILNRYRKTNVLVIEDLGSSRPIGAAESDFSLRVIYSILDERLEWEQQTIITTNKTLENLRSSFDERIASRLSILKWIGVGGRDKRVTDGK